MKLESEEEGGQASVSTHFWMPEQELHGGQPLGARSQTWQEDHLGTIFPYVKLVSIILELCVHASTWSCSLVSANKANGSFSKQQLADSLAISKAICPSGNSVNHHEQPKIFSFKV